MPTPLGHALAGIAVAGVSGSKERLKAWHVGVLIFCAAAADLDLLLRFVDGANHHRGASHSLAAAILAGLVGLFLRRLGVDLPSPMAITAAWASHVVLDFFGLDTSPPHGEMALWPVSHAFYVSPVVVFYDVRRAFTLSALSHNALAAAIELLVLVPIVMICWNGFLLRKPDSR